MCDSQNNVRFTWQLVSQFVSWEFCRCMGEQPGDSTAENDVLTFLRNMIVQRTERSMSEITKHEIVAKFIMETKQAQDISRMSCIIPLSESVKKIFPEIEMAVNKLVDYLEKFLIRLDSTEEMRKDIIHVRIDSAVNDFIKEANRLLPQPHLLQVIECWNAQQGNSQPRPVKKVIYDAELFEKVLECIHFEGITAAEAKVIGVTLQEDKVFEKILHSAQAEPETEADSEQFSLSVTASQPYELPFSQEFVKNSQTCNAVPIHLQPSNTENHEPDSSDSLQFDNCNPANLDDIPNIPEFGSNVQSPPVYPLIHRNIAEHNEVANLDDIPNIPEFGSNMQSPAVYPLIHRNTAEHNEVADLQFAQSSANESEDGSSAEGTVSQKFRQFYNNQRTQKLSNSDTSDCDKDPIIKFLTPTLYKKNKKKKLPQKPKVIYLSDCSSNNSSIITNVTNSQQNDPNWSMRESVLEQFQKKKSKKKLPPKKPVRLLDSDSSDDNSPLRNLAMTEQPQPSTSAAHNGFERESLTKRRRVEKNVKLYGSPNISMHDFVSRFRKPNPITSNEIPVHASTNTRSSRKKTVATPKQNNNKRQKCKQCTKAFKTVIALRRHVFLKHTDAVGGDSDYDS